jgi:pSer/pThr/pTyr-binding forkhead associated (FHA) protein
MIRMILLSAGSPQRRIEVRQLPAMIGRDESADIHLGDSWVGHFQCILDQEEGHLRVLDLGSRNGTFVNGRRVKRADLMPGDTLTIGRTDFVVYYEDAAVPA